MLTGSYDFRNCPEFLSYNKSLRRVTNIILLTQPQSHNYEVKKNNNFSFG